MSATPEPRSVRAGDTIAWLRELPQHPAPAWSLVYTLINGQFRRTISAQPAGESHSVLVPAADSAQWAAGEYVWVAAATQAATRVSVGQGRMQVLPNIAALQTFDSRSPARQALDDVNAALRSFGNKAWMQSYSIGGRSQTFRSLADFMVFRSQLEREVAQEAAAERIAAGLQPANRLLVRFRGRR